MLTVDAALAAILAETMPLPATRVALADALGLVLAEDIVSDIDSPPFDKAVMDGFAVRSADVAGGTAELEVLEDVSAGRTPTRALGPGQAARIMTGAPLPAGADAVVRIEDTQVDGAFTRVRVRTLPVRPGQNTLLRGTSLRAGEVVVRAGRELRPQELGALAELGRHRVAVYPRPRVGVLATGDELVPIDQVPGPGQIRNSNETMLAAQIRRAGAEPVLLGIARDELTHLSECIGRGLGCDVLLLSGGVSAGTKDLVPAALAAAGVRQVFHKVDVKPGKPIWFGVLEGVSRRYVFGLPGNPVSSLVCFELFARTAVRRLMGTDPALPQAVRARLAQEHLARGERPTYHPARLDWTEAGPVVQVVRWHGSADLRATVAANAMALFLPGERLYPAGEPVDVFAW